MSKIRPKKVKSKKVNLTPPPLNTKPVHSMVFRFKADSAVISQPICRRSLLSLMISNSVVTQTDCITIFGAVKLRKVEVWSPPSSDVDLVTTTIEWQDPRGPAATLSDVGNTVRLAHICSKPPKGSVAEMWSNFYPSFVNEALFNLSCPTNSIIDIHISFVLANGTGLTDNNKEYTIRTVTTGVVGNFYVDLDNSSTAGASGTNLMSPVLPMLASANLTN